MRDGHDATVVAPLAFLPSLPRDPAFKLMDVGCLQILPTARVRRNVMSFVTVGFDAELDDNLQAIYRRHQVKGFGLPAGAVTGPELLSRIDALSGVPAPARFDCLSLLGGVTASNVLDMVKAGTFRPGLIHCADTSSFDDWSRVRIALAALRYICVGELQGAEIFIDSPLFDEPDPRPAIATFDVFDTLIARRCFDPWRIFQQVGDLAGLPDFLLQRREAEARVLGTKYVFDDIYDELARHYGWSDARRREVQALELTCEQEAVVPIVENLSQVRDGDLLVSDMYLSEGAIRTLLARAGLKAQVGLLVESHGKSSGRVWPLIDAHYRVTQHLGDNAQADVAVPKRFGLQAELTRTSDLSLVERTLMQTGLRQLALFCREVRLSSWHDEPAMRSLQLIEASLNLPLLVLMSVLVARRATALGKTSVAFCSRDCNLWLPLFNLVQARMGLKLETHYFLTSRIARKQGSDTYLAYARERMGRDTLVVDLCGTGWSMANLAERLGLDACDLFLIDHCPPLDAFERTKRTPKTCVVHTPFANRPNANNIMLELANMADHGMVVDMRAVGHAFVPVLAPDPLSPEERRAIDLQRACFLGGLEKLAPYDLRDVFELDDPSLAFLGASLYEYMSKQTGSYELFAQKFLRENDAIVRTLTT